MSSRLIGTVARGLCAPPIRPGVDMVELTARTVLAAAAQEGVILHKTDLIGVAGTIVSRAQNNCVTVDSLAREVQEKFGEEATIGLLWPTFSTSYISAVLRGLARGAKKLVLQLAYPQDETGRSIIPLEALYDRGVDPYEDTLSEEGYLTLFGDEEANHGCGREYMDFCRSIAESENCEIQFLFSNHAQDALIYSRDILYCHHRRSPRMEKKLKARGVRRLYGLDDLCTEPRDGSGYHPTLGLIGAVSDSSGQVLLAPRDTEVFEKAVSDAIFEQIGVAMRVLVFPNHHIGGVTGQGMAPLCSLMGDSLNADAPLVLLQGYRP